MYTNKFVSEDIVITQFQQGNNIALQQIFNLYYKALVFFANKIINDLPEAEDITAESFFALYNRRENFQSLPQVKAFLYMANRNACLNWLKAKRRHQASHQEIVFLSVPHYTLNQQTVEATVLAQLPKLIAKLPQQCAQVFKMIYYEGMKTGEIAQALGLSNQTVLNHKQRAIRFIRQALNEKHLLLLLPSILSNFF
jgi:RNA polymerase sigma-70 factor (family 1)